MVKPALMFRDKAVLQREKPIAVWGTADPGALVSVAVQGQEKSAVADAEGNWKVLLDPLSVSRNETMTIRSGDEVLSFSDLMVGDVFLAGGQSNMEFHMRYDADMAAEKERCTDPRIRLFDYPEVSFVGQIDMADYSENYGFWRDCDPDNLERYSAVAYYFAKEIAARYDIPVGILDCNWGGTPAMAWVPEEISVENGDAHRIEEYHRTLDTLDIAAYDQQFINTPQNYNTDQLSDPISDLMLFGASQEEFMAAIGQMMAAQGIDPSTLDPSAFQQVIGPKHAWRPAGVYYSMLLPCVPYGIKAFLWYQGCSDSDAEADAIGYKTLFPALIRHWRGLWGEELPFLFVQLAPLDHWMQSSGVFYPLTRAAQQHAADTVQGAAMAVIGDVGMQFDIHPKKKQPVGHRLALLAENYVYGEKDVLCEAPTLVGAEVADGQISLRFENAGQGLRLAGTLPTGDAVRKDQVGGLVIYQDGAALDLTEAKASAAGDTVIVCADAIKAGRPTKVSLAETGWYQMNLYNSADIPARPAHVEV